VVEFSDLRVYGCRKKEHQHFLKYAWGLRTQGGHGSGRGSELRQIWWVGSGRNF